MTLLFFGSDPWFSPLVFEALLRAGHNIPIVVTKGEALLDSLSAIRKSLFVQATSTEDITKKKLQNVLNQALGVRLFELFDSEDSSESERPEGFSELIESESLRDERPEWPEDSVPSTVKSSELNSPRGTRHQTPAAIVVAAFGPPFLGDDLLDWPTHGCLNVHASLLPRWRGASPVSAAIAAGDRETGVTIMKMTKEIDRGAILGQAKIAIHHPNFKRPGPVPQGQALQGQAFLDEFDTRETLTRRLAALGGELLVNVLGRIGHIRPIRQPHDSPTPYTRRLTKESGRIDWSKTPEEVERFIRAMSPWPGAWTEYKDKGQGLRDKGKPMKILKAHLQFPQPSALSPQPSLVLDEVQLPGKNPITWKQFLTGHPGAQLL